MPYVKLSGHQQDGPQASGDCIDVPVQVSLASATTSLQGQCYSYDMTNLVMPDGISNAQIILQNPSIFLQKSARVVLPTSASASVLAGAQQAATFTSLSGATTINPLVLRCWGHGLVLAGAVAAGNAVKIGSMLNFSAFPSASQSFALAVAALAAQPQGLFVGVVQAGYVQTVIPLSFSAGAQTVTPANNAYITTATQLTVDVPSSGVQEVVTPSSIGANANTFTATFANAHGPNTPIAGSLTTAGATAIAVPGSGSYSGAVVAFINV